MSAKSDTLLPGFIYNKIWIFWIVSKNFSYQDDYISGSGTDRKNRKRLRKI